MDIHAIERLLQIVRRELSADDVRAEIGGRAPDAKNVAAVDMPAGFRIVAVFDAPPDDLDQRKQKLQVLADGFAGVGDTRRPPTQVHPEAQETALAEALEELRAQAHAERTLVIDDSSPIIWGSSESPRSSFDVDWAHAVGRAWASCADAKLDPLRTLVEASTGKALPPESLPEATRRQLDRIASWASERPPQLIPGDLRACRAVHLVRDRWNDEDHHRDFAHEEKDLSLMARSFATTYRVLLIFPEPFSELHAEAALVHTIGHIESLVLRLPPVDPGGGGGGAKVLQLQKPR